MSTTHNKSILETSASLAMTPPVALSLSPAFRNWRRTPKKKAAGSLEPTILRPSPGSKIPVVAVVFHFPLVGGWPTPLKILVDGKDYPIWKIKNVPNHQPVQCFTTWCTVCVCVFHAPFGGVKVGPVELPTDASPASFQTQRTQPKAPARG